MEFSDKVGCAIIQMAIPSRFLNNNVGCTVFDDIILHKNEVNYYYTNQRKLTNKISSS